LYDGPYSAPDGIVFIAHPGHGVDLESSPQDVTACPC
jgi:hypothetical protein